VNCKQIFWYEETLDEKFHDFLMLSVNCYEQVLQCMHWNSFNCTKIQPCLLWT